MQLYLVKQGGTELVVSNMKANMLKYIQQAHELLLAGGYTVEELHALSLNVDHLKMQVQSHFANMALSGDILANSDAATPTPPQSPSPGV